MATLVILGGELENDLIRKRSLLILMEERPLQKNPNYIAESICMSINF